MDWVFRPSNDRFDNVSRSTTPVFKEPDIPQAATINARFIAYLEQFYAPRNPRHLLTATVLTLAGAGIAAVGLVAFVREVQLVWPPLALAIVLLTWQVLRLYHRFASRHRLFRVRDVIETGVPVTGYVVQAPSALFQPGTDTLPALVLFSLQPEVSSDAAYLHYLADQLCRAKTAVVTPENRHLAAFAAAEPGVSGRRRLLPYSLTDGSTVYCADIWVSRKYLRNGYLSGEPLPLLAQPGDTGGVELVPWWLTTPATSADQNSDMLAAP